MTDVSDGQDDSRWEAFVTTMLANGHATEGRSRYSGKSALFTGSREIAHLEAPRVIDLRITCTGWAQPKRISAATPWCDVILPAGSAGFASPAQAS